jgi:hypothetical protein
MKLIFILPLFLALQTEVPFKPSDEFQVNVDLKFKIKNSTYPTSTFSGNGDPLDKSSATTLPFLSVTISKIKIQSDEFKIFAVEANGKSLYKKKASPTLLLRFEMGFVDDLKSKVSNNEITIYFLSRDKKELRKIVIAISDKGVFEVNGKWHGQF